jgi:hypothetical protein
VVRPGADPEAGKGRRELARFVVVDLGGGIACAIAPSSPPASSLSSAGTAAMVASRAAVRAIEKRLLRELRGGGDNGLLPDRIARFNHAVRTGSVMSRGARRCHVSVGQIADPAAFP